MYELRRGKNSSGDVTSNGVWVDLQILGCLSHREPFVGDGLKCFGHWFLSGAILH